MPRKYIKHHQKKDHQALTIFLSIAIAFVAITSVFFLINDNDTKIPQKEVTIILDTNKILANKTANKNLGQDDQE